MVLYEWGTIASSSVPGYLPLEDAPSIPSLFLSLNRDDDTGFDWLVN
jgi:hypothetical protein